MMKIVSLASLEKAVLETNRLFSHARPWWRGHAKQSWELIPRVFRAEAKGGKPYNERELFAHFRDRATTRYTNHPGVRDHIGWMFLAQHYGLPTRLLDWTASPLIGLYFAVSDETHDSEPGHLHALSPGRMNKVLAGQYAERFSTLEPFVQQYALDAIGQKDKVHTDPLPNAVAIGTREIDVRMLVQQSVFTLHSDATALSEVASDPPILATFVIPASAKQQLRWRLAWLGLRPASVFPDLEHLAAELRAAEFLSVPV
jgi:FRG domain